MTSQVMVGRPPGGCGMIGAVKPNSHLIGWLLAASTAVIGALAAAQTPASPPSPTARVIAAEAAIPADRNTMAQRMVACSTCHGAQGRAAPDGYYPRIAGKPAGYLYNQLLNFREGRRHYGMMIRMVDPLTDEYLWEIAKYFSALDLPYPPPQPPASDAATLARGQRLVREGDAARGIPACAACHGDAMTGRAPGIPGLLGVPRDYINSQLGAWRAGERRSHVPDCMADIARRLSLQDINALSSWLAAQALPTDAHPIAADDRPLPLTCGSARAPAAVKSAGPAPASEPKANPGARP